MRTILVAESKQCSGRIETASFKKSHGISYPGLSLKILIIPICIILYFILSNDTENKYNIPNILIFCISLMICLWSVNDIIKKNIMSYNLFLLIFYFFLLWNTLNISSLQFKKEFSDLYFYFAGPLLFSMFLFLGERVPVKKIKISHDNLNKNANLLILIIFIFYILISYYIYTQVGFRIFSDKLIKYSKGAEYAVPRFSGLAFTLMWTMIIFIPKVKTYLMVLITTSTIMISGILQFKRGNIFRIILFLFIYYCYRNRETLFKKKNMITIVLILSSTVYLFGYIGDLRQFDYANIFDIKAIMQSKYDSNTLNWLYSYTAMNFDVLKTYFDSDPTYIPYDLILPFMNLLGYEEQISKYYDSMGTTYLGISNASPFLTGFINDYGNLYILEMAIFGFLVCMLLFIIRMLQFTGLYVLVQMFIVLTFTGNYFKVSGFFSVILFSLFLYICCMPNFTHLLKKTIYGNQTVT